MYRFASRKKAALPNAVEAALSQVDPDALSPREALDALDALKKLAERQ